MSLSYGFLKVYGMLGGDPAKLSDSVKHRILANEITNPTHTRHSRSSVGIAALAALEFLSTSLPAIVYSQEKTAQREQESQENPLIHRLIFGVGKSSDGSDSNATVRFLNKGFYYSVNNWTGEELTSGFMPYDELIPTRNYLEEKNDKNSNGKILGGFFGKIGPTHDDYVRDILREMLSRRNELPKDATAQIEQGQLKYLKLKNAKYGDAKDDEPVIKFLPSGNLQKPENPPTLEGKLRQFVINSSQGQIYSEVEGDQISYALKDDNGKTLREGVMDRNNPRDSLELKISVGSINVLDKKKLKEEGEKQRYETIRNERVKSVKGWLLNISPNISNLENRINWGVVAEGLIPVFYRDNSLIGVQFRGEYARVEAGDSFAESAIGIVVNTAINDTSKHQIGIFYQDRREIGKGAHFGVASGTFAYRAGKLKISVYGGIPVTGRQKIRSELTSAESTASDTTGGNTVTTTTRIDRRLREYLEARKVATVIAGYDLTENLTPEAGIAWYSGKSGRTREIGNFKETREGVPSELKAIFGINYKSQPLSHLFNRLTELYLQGRFGRGSPEFDGGIRISLGWTYEEVKKQKDGGIVDLLEMARMERIRVMKYSDVEERKSRSPQILSGACPTTGTEGVEYVCDIRVDGSDFRLVAGPSFLALVKTGEHTARYSGTPGFSDEGTHQIEIRARNPSNGLESILKYALTIADSNRAPVISSSPGTTGTTGVAYAYTPTATDADGDTITWSLITAPSGATVNSNTGAVSFTTNTTGNYNFTLQANDSKGGIKNQSWAVAMSSANNPPTLNTIGNRSVNENSLLEFIISCSNCDSTSASNLPSGATYNTSTKTFLWTPNFAQGAQNYNVTFSATNSAGTTNQTITITVNDVAVSISISPSANQNIDAGDFINWQSTPSHSGTIAWNTTSVAGTCATIASAEDPGITPYNDVATCDVNVSLTVSGGVTVTSPTIRAIVGSGGG